MASGEPSLENSMSLDRPEDLDLESKLARGLKKSFVFHAALIFFFTIKTLILPEKITPYVPTLRVDIVGLPDHLVKDQGTIPLSDTQEPAKAKKAKTTAKDVDLPVKDPLYESEKSKQARMSQALKRLQSLEKIRSENEMPEVIKGNVVSKGESLTGETNETLSSKYLDSVLQKLRLNWELPLWLSRQNLSAQVSVTIDPRGALQGMRFIKLSGNPQFDDAVRQAIIKSQPFLPPPGELRETILLNGILLGFPL